MTKYVWREYEGNASFQTYRIDSLRDNETNYDMFNGRYLVYADFAMTTLNRVLYGYINENTINIHALGVAERTWESPINKLIGKYANVYSVKESSELVSARPNLMLGIPNDLTHDGNYARNGSRVIVGGIEYTVKNAYRDVVAKITNVIDRYNYLEVSFTLLKANLSSYSKGNFLRYVKSDDKNLFPDKGLKFYNWSNSWYEFDHIEGSSHIKTNNKTILMRTVIKSWGGYWRPYQKSSLEAICTLYKGVDD